MEKFNEAGLGYWLESTSIASTTNHHKISQRFWELEEIILSANRLRAKKARCEQHFIDSNHRAEDGTTYNVVQRGTRYNVNQAMKQTKNQPSAIEPLQLCTNHKPNMKSAVIKNVMYQFPKL
jgi:hypothetical protein